MAYTGEPARRAEARGRDTWYIVKRNKGQSQGRHNEIGRYAVARNGAK